MSPRTITQKSRLEETVLYFQALASNRISFKVSETSNSLVASDLDFSENDTAYEAINL